MRKRFIHLDNGNMRIKHICYFWKNMLKEKSTTILPDWHSAWHRTWICSVKWKYVSCIPILCLCVKVTSILPFLISSGINDYLALMDIIVTSDHYLFPSNALTCDHYCFIDVISDIIKSSCTCGSKPTQNSPNLFCLPWFTQ